MKCWKCGEENAEGRKQCAYCGTNLNRALPETAFGKGLRLLYDRYGAVTVFSNNLLLVNGIGDVVQDVYANELRKFKNHLKTVLDAGVGRMYLEQITIGALDSGFCERVRTKLTEDADLSEKGAREMMGYFDEMIGWQQDTASQITSPVHRDLKVGDIIFFGFYVQDNIGKGPEPIEWQVLAVEDGRALVISRYILDAKPYNDILTDVTWETCTLRKWLNSDFYNTAFISAEKAQIQEMLLKNPNNPEDDTYGGRSTRDHIFLLSIDELDTYFDDKTDEGICSARVCKATAYARANGEKTASWYGENSARWWLRSPGEGTIASEIVGFSSGFAATVFEDGCIFPTGFRVDHTFGVRPAFWLNL